MHNVIYLCWLRMRYSIHFTIREMRFPILCLECIRGKRTGTVDLVPREIVEFDVACVSSIFDLMCAHAMPMAERAFRQTTSMTTIWIIGHKHIRAGRTGPNQKVLHWHSSAAVDVRRSLIHIHSSFSANEMASGRAKQAAERSETPKNRAKTKFDIRKG